MKKLLLLKSLLFLCTLIVGSSAWAEDVTVATGTFAKTTISSGWTSTGTGTSTTGCVIYGKDESLTSPSLDLSGYSKITISISARRYGTLSGSKATIDASIGGVSKGTTNATSTSVTSLTNIVFTPTETMTAVNIVFTCTNATSAGSTHGAGIGSITIKGTPKSSDPSIDADDVIIDYDATGGTITSTINNPVVGGVLTAEKKTSADWLTLGSVSGTNVPFTTTTNDGATNRTVTVTLTYTYNTSETVTKDVTITQNHEVRDYATLPFSWAGGTKAELNALDGVSTNADNSDYAVENAPYRLKFNDTGKYVIVKTDCQPTKVTMGVKMIGGATTSTMTIQESADGKTYTNVQTLSISGSSGAIVNLESTNPFSSTTRYVKFLYTKGSNVGVGPITISKTQSATLAASGYTTLVSGYPLDFISVTGLDKAFIVTTANTSTATLAEVTAVPANTGVILKGTANANLSIPVATYTGGALTNLLEGSATVAASVSPNSVYVISGGEFKLFTGTEIIAGKAYLPKPAGARDFLNFAFDNETTGINASLVNNEKNMVNSVYDLQGRRVAQPTKGLYIVNGKKVIIK